MLVFFIKLFKAINSNSHPGEIAHAVCCGMILGFLPKDNALWYIITVFCLFLRIHKGAFVIFTLLFSLLAPLLDPLFDTIGYWFLTLDFFRPTFSFLLDIPFVGFTKFNNTIVAGSILSSIVLYIPVYWLTRLFIKEWRTFLLPIVRKTKLVKMLSNLPMIKKIGDLV